MILDLGAEAEEILASHEVDSQLAREAHKSEKAFRKFVEDRERRLKAFIATSLGL